VRVHLEPLNTTRAIKHKQEHHGPSFTSKLSKTLTPSSRPAPSRKHEALQSSMLPSDGRLSLSRTTPYRGADQRAAEHGRLDKRLQKAGDEPLTGGSTPACQQPVSWWPPRIPQPYSGSEVSRCRNVPGGGRKQGFRRGSCPSLPGVASPPSPPCVPGDVAVLCHQEQHPLPTHRYRGGGEGGGEAAGSARTGEVARDARRCAPSDYRG